MPKRPSVSALIFATFSVLYPLVAVVLLRKFGPTTAVVLVIVLLVARLAVPVLRGVPLLLTAALVPVIAAMGVVALFDQVLSIRLYPVFMNMAMLVTFGSTLLHPPSMAERFARVLEPDLPQEGVRYTRTVTKVWTGFFCLNGTIALATALQPGWNAWVLYNGFIAYLAAGLLFMGEYLIRQRVRRRGAR
jgi:uncharacterized membrane protein